MHQVEWWYCDACDDVHHPSEDLTDAACEGDENDPSCNQPLFVLTEAEQDILTTVRRTQTIKAVSRVKVTGQSAYTGYSGIVLGVQSNGYAVKLTHGPGDRPVRVTETFFCPNEIGLA